LAGLDAKAIHAPWERAPLAMQGVDYPRPVVDHAVARERTLARYAVVKTRALP
jgi:deoxyribodipyrimidine photo-lyase